VDLVEFLGALPRGCPERETSSAAAETGTPAKKELKIFSGGVLTQQKTAKNESGKCRFEDFRENWWGEALTAAFGCCI
jgi:hypothetical protein